MDFGLLQALGGEWQVAMRLFFAPVNLLLLGVAVALVDATANAPAGPLSVSLTILLGLVTSVVGGYWTLKYIEIAQQGPLRQRGRGAVRGLRLLLQNLQTLESRVLLHQKNHVARDRANEPLSMALDEIATTATTLQEQTISAIEDWTDVVPEAGVGTQLGLLTEMKRSRRSVELRKTRAALEQRLAALETDLGAARAQQLASQPELEARVLATRRELDDVRAQLRAKELPPTGLRAGGPPFSAAGAKPH